VNDLTTRRPPGDPPPGWYEGADLCERCRAAVGVELVGHVDPFELGSTNGDFQVWLCDRCFARDVAVLARYLRVEPDPAAIEERLNLLGWFWPANPLPPDEADEWQRSINEQRAAFRREHEGALT